MVLERRAVSLLLGLFAITGSTILADEADPLRDPRLGGSPGRLRYRVVRSPTEEVPAPDVLTLDDGTRLEAYFLETYGDWFVFYVKEGGTSWLKEELPRKRVTSVNLQSYLPQDPIQPKRIEAAEKQPVPKDDILHGVFTAARGRRQPIDFRLSFTSETDKIGEFVEDATDFGVVELESRTRDKSWDSERSHAVRGMGRYHLYAPGSVNNTDWVLVLSQMVQYERDRQGRETVLTTSSILDETFIVRFDPEKESFRLEWSTVGEWTWASLLGMTFTRRDDTELAPPPRTSPRSPKARPILVEGGDKVLARSEPPPTRWGIRDWKPPRYRLR
jgi:hypothetical protein